RHRAARAALAAPALDRFPAWRRAERDGRRDRDRPLHLLAGPGPDLQGRPACDRTPASRDRGARRLVVRLARLPRCGPRPRLAVPGNTRPRTAHVGRRTGLRFRSGLRGAVRAGRRRPTLWSPTVGWSGAIRTRMAIKPRISC